MFSQTDIPVRLRDNTLRIGVAWYALCIALRLCLGLGMIIFNSWMLRERWILWIIIGVMLITGLGFLKKYYVVRPVWKVYMRYILVAICVIVLLSYGLWTTTRAELISIAGVLILIDVLMGVTTRYMASM